MIREGAVIAKRYEIEGRVGSGGMADVYKAMDHKLNRYVAVKVLKSTYRSDEVFVKKFLTEARSAAGLMHPNVVNVYDVGQDRGIYYMVMELVEGITLKEYIEKKGRLSAKEAISISIQMVTGIQAAHNCHIIHRDIKPQNIIISTEGKVKVTDFGIARATTSTQTISTSVMGSVHYTSPEQAKGGIVDEKSDIYSAGITMYEMVTGHVPFDGDSTVTVALKHLQEEITAPSEEVEDLPYSLECIILKCTKKDPKERYASCAELLQDLKHSLVDPDGDFVFGIPASGAGDDRTAVMSDEEREEMLRRYRDNEPEDDDGYEDDYDYGDDDGYDDGYEDEDDRRDYRESSREKKKKQQQKTIIMIIVGVVAALLIIVLIAFAMGVFGGGSSSEEEDTAAEEELIEVPSVLGMTEDEAKETLNGMSLGFYVSGTSPSSEYAEGEIMSQDPESGDSVEENTTVNVVVSTGEEPETTEVPSVVGLSEEKAETAITNANLVVKHGESEYSDTVEAGYVISVSPDEGKEVEEGTEVTIVVSLGEEPATVPKLTGKSKSDAQSALSAAGLKGSYTEEYSDSVDAGYVISQDTAAGKEVAKGTTISYVVSLGEEITIVSVPDLLSKNESTAKKLLSSAGLTAENGGEVYSDTYSAGQVCYQSISSGTEVEEGTTVTYKVSLGSEPVEEEEETAAESESESESESGSESESESEAEEETDSSADEESSSDTTE